jgi:putative sigma-54 modulation protein
MRLELTGRHLDITPALRGLVDKKLARLERILNDSAVSAAVVLADEPGGRRTDVSLHARGEKFLHAVAVASTWDTAMRQAVDKLAGQARKVKDRWRAKKRRGGKVSTRQTAAPRAGVEPPAPRETLRRPRTMRSTRQVLKAMSVADALRELEVHAEGILVFRDAETEAISVLFRRANGELTLVETEA